MTEYARNIYLLISRCRNVIQTYQTICVLLGVDRDELERITAIRRDIERTLADLPAGWDN